MHYFFRIFRSTGATPSTDNVGETRFINQRFITEKPHVSQFSTKFPGPLDQKTRSEIPKQLSMEEMVRMSSIHTPSLVEIGDTRTKIREFVFLFCLSVTLGLFWSLHCNEVQLRHLLINLHRVREIFRRRSIV